MWFLVASGEAQASLGFGPFLGLSSVPLLLPPYLSRAEQAPVLQGPFPTVSLPAMVSLLTDVETKVTSKVTIL